MSERLKTYASDPQASRGRCYPEPEATYRSVFQRDRDRIIHSRAFRRLEYKTQVFVNHEGDLYRTRLTHTIEVAQIARTVARQMGLNEDLVEAIALAHDLGHTPFGHAGQDALNECMVEYGGFEHNLQSLRVVDELEHIYADFSGLNLCYETREGILKHCDRENAARLGELGQRFLKKTQPSLEAQLTNIADEIAYNNHDVDDGLRSGLITLEQLNELTLFKPAYDKVHKTYPDLQGGRLTHEILRRLIEQMVVDLIDSSQHAIQAASVTTADEVRAHAQPLMRYSIDLRRQKNELKQFLYQNLYRHPEVYRMSWRAVEVVKALFKAFMSDQKLLPLKYQALAKQREQEQGKAGRARVIADYIAGMTDRYALREYSALFDFSLIR